MTEELKELEGDKIPVWLENQMKQAKVTATPMTPQHELGQEESGAAQLLAASADKGQEEDPLFKASANESFRGSTAEKYSKKVKKKTKTKKEEPVTNNSFQELASELAEMLTEKNRKYGDSYARMAHVLPIFYPDGVPGDHLLDAVFILRIVDKLMRIASAQKDDDEDPVMDIAGYAILRMREMRRAE